MQNVSPIFTKNDEIDTDADLYEDVDSLFGRLEKFQPPTGLVGRIMDAVSKLPPYPQLPQTTIHDQEGMIVQHNHKQPS